MGFVVVAGSGTGEKFGKASWVVPGRLRQRIFTKQREIWIRGSGVCGVRKR